MQAFEYLSVLISIVLGLGITQLLSGFARWLELRSRMKAYSPAIIWAAFLLVTHVQTWWAMFGLRHSTDWTFLQFSIVLLQPSLLYLMAALVFPGAASTQEDLRANFFRHKTWFFGIFIALLAVSVGKDLALTGALPGAENLAFHGALLATGLVALVTRKDLYQRLAAIAALALILLYVFALFADLA